MQVPNDDPGKDGKEKVDEDRGYAEDVRGRTGVNGAVAVGVAAGVDVVEGDAGQPEAEELG